MPLASAAFMSVTWAANECVLQELGGAPRRNSHFSYSQRHLGTPFLVFWATARAAGDSCQPGIPTVKSLLSCLCLKPWWATLLWDSFRTGICVVQNKAGASTQDQRGHALPDWRSFMGAGAKLAQTHHNSGVCPHPLPQPGQHAQEANKVLLLPHLNQGTFPQKKEILQGISGQQSSFFYWRLLINYHPSSLPSHLPQAHS